MTFPASNKLGLLIGFMAVGIAPASADLIGQTFNANIEITGSDDHGAYTISVLNGPVTGPVVNDQTPVFKQLTQMGFATASNQITGSVTLNISANAISVNFNGQASVKCCFTTLPQLQLTLRPSISASSPELIPHKPRR